MLDGGWELTNFTASLDQNYREIRCVGSVQCMPCQIKSWAAHKSATRGAAEMNCTTHRQPGRGQIRTSIQTELLAINVQSLVWPMQASIQTASYAQSVSRVHACSQLPVILSSATFIRSSSRMCLFNCDCCPFLCGLTAELAYKLLCVEIQIYQSNHQDYWNLCP